MSSIPISSIRSWTPVTGSLAGKDSLAGSPTARLDAAAAVADRVPRRARCPRLVHGLGRAFVHVPEE